MVTRPDKQRRKKDGMMTVGAAGKSIVENPGEKIRMGEGEKTQSGPRRGMGETDEAKRNRKVYVRSVERGRGRKGGRGKYRL